MLKIRRDRDILAKHNMWNSFNTDSNKLTIKINFQQTREVIEQDLSFRMNELFLI
jgi:hypothetical protein